MGNSDAATRFQEIYNAAVSNKGGEHALDELLPSPRTAGELRATPDDRYLAEMSKCIFRAGFVWQVVENKWPGFEKAFRGFNPAVVAALSDEEIERLASDPSIIRNLGKIQAVRSNAVFVQETAAEHGSFGAFVADWPGDDVVGLLQVLKKRGARLGGNTGHYFLRFMGKDAFMFSKDVVTALVNAGVVAKQPTSQRDLAAAQQFFVDVRKATDRPLCQISRILAASIS